MIQFSQADIDRFFKYVEKLPNGCWFWTGARSRGKGNKKWYGSFGVKGKVIRAHRFSCEALANPPKHCPPEHDRDHTCLFSLCVNPDHLEVVHKKENHRRKIERRAALPKIDQSGLKLVKEIACKRVSSVLLLGVDHEAECRSAAMAVLHERDKKRGMFS